jgi:hypothetical protein
MYSAYVAPFAHFCFKDTWYWDEELAYGQNPAQVFVMLYLQDTSASNGCLRVLPGTHLQWHDSMHGLLASDTAHSNEVVTITKSNAHSAVFILTFPTCRCEIRRARRWSIRRALIWRMWR